MVEVKEYFDGKVKSMVVNAATGRQTVGVITAGEYEFATSTKETMTVISGSMSVYLSEYDEWEDFDAGASFDIPANTTFKIKVEADTAYLCEYE